MGRLKRCSLCAAFNISEKKRRDSPFVASKKLSRNLWIPTMREINSRVKAFVCPIPWISENIFSADISAAGFPDGLQQSTHEASRTKLHNESLGENAQNLNFTFIFGVRSQTVSWQLSFGPHTFSFSLEKARGLWKPSDLRIRS